MSDSDKTLQTKHARITGQDMRGHWGPIIDQIADETTDIRDARIEALEAENERLRGALAEIEGIGYDDFDPLGMAHEIATAALKGTEQ